jgi:hypothetical protein
MSTGSNMLAALCIEPMLTRFCIVPMCVVLCTELITYGFLCWGPGLLIPCLGSLFAFLPIVTYKEYTQTKSQFKDRRCVKTTSIASCMKQNKATWNKTWSNETEEFFCCHKQLGDVHWWCLRFEMLVSYQNVHLVARWKCIMLAQWGQNKVCQTFWR